MKEVKRPLIPSYRDRVYQEYVSSFKQTDSRTLVSEAQKHARFFDHLLLPLLEETNRGSVLEAGCGPGHFLYWAESRGFSQVRGFDLSSQQVALARSMGLDAVQTSFQDHLPRFNQSFDLIVALDLIEHLTRDEGLEFLELSRAALRPGGIIFLTTPNGSALRPGPVAAGDLTHETIYSPQTISLALRLSGYEHTRVREIVPPPTSLRSRIRRALWQVIRLAPMAVDLIETASSTRVYSRNMAVQARRPLQQ